MKHHNRVRLFEEWAERYEPSVRGDGSFPFDGYKRVLEEIVRFADVRCGMRVLDLGIGTGNLAIRFAELGCDIWGVDFSVAMLAKARERLPRATLLPADLVGEWLPELNLCFDRIVSAYLLHEFDLPAKVKLLKRLADHHLTGDGRMVIGDIAFTTVAERDRMHRIWADAWDEDEHYWAADETAEVCKSAGLAIIYRQISMCGGVCIITPEIPGMWSE